MELPVPGQTGYSAWRWDGNLTTRRDAVPSGLREDWKLSYKGAGVFTVSGSQSQ